MKRDFRHFFTALAFAAASACYAAQPALCSDAEEDAADGSRDVSSSYLDFYVGSNARWLVDRQTGTVAAWELKRPLPLWSSDGVVYRQATRRTNVVEGLTSLRDVEPSPTIESFGRVYFFLNDVSRRRSTSAPASFVRRDDLLLAIDLEAQGRLVWARRADDFARFFPPDVSSLCFLPQLKPLPNDELLVFVQGDQETKCFAVDAAAGTARLLDASSKPE